LGVFYCIINCFTFSDIVYVNDYERQVAEALHLKNKIKYYYYGSKRSERINQEKKI
jgi:hypothetical protein